MPEPQNDRLDPKIPLTLSIEEAALALGVSRGRAYESAREGEIPTIPLGRRRRVPTARLAEMLGVSAELLADRLSGNGSA